jgi:hypothetical protein
MTTMNEAMAHRATMRAIMAAHIEWAIRRNATALSMPASVTQDRYRRTVREALVIAATASVALGEHESVGQALTALSEQHGITTIGH